MFNINIPGMQPQQPAWTQNPQPGMQWNQIGPASWQQTPDPMYAPPAPGYVTEDPMSIAGRVNPYMTEQAQAPYLANLPNYAAMTQQRSDVIGQQLRGEVPRDVINQIMQTAAERGISTGSPGGQGSNAAFLQALGLTSIGQQQAGMQALSGAISDTPVPEIFNPASLYVPERLGYQEWQAGAGRNPFAGSPEVQASAAPIQQSNLPGFSIFNKLAEQANIRSLRGIG